MLASSNFRTFGELQQGSLTALSLNGGGRTTNHECRQRNTWRLLAKVFGLDTELQIRHVMQNDLQDVLVSDRSWMRSEVKWQLR
jgi:hypothetical protein